MQEISQLLNAAAAGDTDAISNLLERFGSRVAASIAGQIAPAYRSIIDVDDVMQVTYLEAFLRVNTMQARDEVSYVAWLKRIAQNNLRDAIRELDRKKRPNPARRAHAGSPRDHASYVTLVELLGAQSATPSRDIAQQEAVDVLSTLLDRLPPDYSKVVRWYDLEEKPIEEVAAALNRSSGAIYMLRARAHDLLRELILEETDFLTRTA